MIADLCADVGWGYYVALQLPNVGPWPLIAGPFYRYTAAWRAMLLIEQAFPAVAHRLALRRTFGDSPADFPTVRDPALGENSMGRGVPRHSTRC
jgi:hypothetical protein